MKYLMIFHSHFYIPRMVYELVLVHIHGAIIKMDFWRSFWNFKTKRRIVLYIIFGAWNHQLDKQTFGSILKGFELKELLVWFKGYEREREREILGEIFFLGWRWYDAITRKYIFQKIIIKEKNGKRLSGPTRIKRWKESKGWNFLFLIFCESTPYLAASRIAPICYQWFSFY